MAEIEGFGQAGHRFWFVAMIQRFYVTFRGYGRGEKVNGHVEFVRNADEIWPRSPSERAMESAGRL